MANRDIRKMYYNDLKKLSMSLTSNQSNSNKSITPCAPSGPWKDRSEILMKYHQMK